MPSAHAITLLVYLLLQSGETVETRKWLTLAKEPSLTYDKDDLYYEPELIAADSISLAPTINTLVEAMETDLENFARTVQRHIEKTRVRVRRGIKEELKMPRKPELRHQYGMLFNHQGYVMPGLQSLQLFLAIDLPKMEDLYHDPPAFPNCTEWAASYPPNMDYYNTMGEGYIKMDSLQGSE